MAISCTRWTGMDTAGFTQLGFRIVSNLFHPSERDAGGARGRHELAPCLRGLPFPSNAIAYAQEDFRIPGRAKHAPPSICLIWTTRGGHHDDQNGDGCAGDCRAGSCPIRCGSKEVQALQAKCRSRTCQCPDVRTLSHGRSDHAAVEHLWIVWRSDRNGHRSIHRNILVAFGRRNQRAPDLEQHHASGPVTGLLSVHASRCGRCEPGIASGLERVRVPRHSRQSFADGKAWSWL